MLTSANEPVTTARLAAPERRGSRLVAAADWIAAAVLLTLPWSTSITSALIVLWLLAVLPTLELASVRDSMKHPAASLPLLLWAFLALGMLWADASWSERWDGLRHFHKLLILPLLIIHFSRSERGLQVFAALIVSAVILLVYSWASYRWPGLVWGDRRPGVPVKDSLYQNMFFVLASCLLLHLSITLVQTGRNALAMLSLLVVVLFLANIVVVFPSRTALVVLPLLLIVIGYQRFGKKGALAVIASSIVLAAIAWSTSPSLRERVTELVEGTREFQREADTSESRRIEFWIKSVMAIAEKPILGHGTGSISGLFAKQATGEKGAAAMVIDNPHNQTFAVGIQIGALGIVVLFLMWASHMFIFRGAGLTASFGVLVVLQNIVGSVFNSHLSDFTTGWLYVFGVGILAGTVLNDRHRKGNRAACSPAALIA